MPGSQSKLYLMDPLLARLPHPRDGWVDDADMTRLTENHLALELARAMDRVAPDRFVEQRAVLYARSEAGKEVDFAALPLLVGSTPVRTTPIESKWVTQSWRRDALVLRGKYGRGLVATKDVVDLGGDGWAVPAPILALLLA